MNLADVETIINCVLEWTHFNLTYQLLLHKAQTTTTLYFLTSATIVLQMFLVQTLLLLLLCI